MPDALPDRVGAAAAARISRRELLRTAALLGIGTSTLGILEGAAWRPRRAEALAPRTLPDIQHAIGDYIAPARSIDGVEFRFGPVYTLFAPARLTRTPTPDDQVALLGALDAVEASYPFSPAGVFTIVAYGIPYFDRLPGGMRGSLVTDRLPRLLGDPKRCVLEEAVPGPTDLGASNSGITKATFRVPLSIETHDLLVTLRSDSREILSEVFDRLSGGDPRLADLLHFDRPRLMFTQPGLPRSIADSHGLPYSSSINPQSPMWMGFADQQVNASGPPEITTFAGNPSARISTARAGDYFDNGAIQHLSHVILDLAQFYAKPAEPFTERCQYMFRSNPIPSVGAHDQFTDGGGPSYLPNVFQGTDDARRNAEGVDTYRGQRRMGHLAGLQRSSRAADGTPMHIRMDGPGFDDLDVPGGGEQPKLQFTVFVPSADFFATMRRNQAALDLVRRYKVHDDDNGLERFLTTTRRQNFLVPPRRHRAFPLLELAT